MSSPKITVLTAVRNGEKYLPETIACIQAQTFTDWEYIIVDDASSDATVDVVNLFAAGDDRIRLIRRKKQGGPFTSANDGVKAARGKYIVRIDADDLSPPHRIEHQMQFFNVHSEYRACISPWRSFNKNGMIPGTISHIPTRSRSLKWYLILRPFASHSSLCIEKSALLEVGGYRELPAAQDYRLLAELSRRLWVGINSEVLSYVRSHSARISNTFGDSQRQLGIQILQEHSSKVVGQRFSFEELDDLMSVSQGRYLAVERGLMLLIRWRTIWQHAPALDDLDRSDLQRLFDYHLTGFLRANYRKQGKQILWVFLKHPSILKGIFPYIREFVWQKIKQGLKE